MTVIEGTIYRGLRNVTLGFADPSMTILEKTEKRAVQIALEFLRDKIQRLNRQVEFPEPLEISLKEEPP